MGELAALTAALAWAVAVSLIRLVPVSMPASRMNSIRLLAPAIATPVLMFATGMQGEFMELRWQNFAALAVSVVTSVGAGDILLFRAMRTIGLVRSYTIGGTFPLFGLFYAALLLGERVGGLAIAGTLLIVGGGALVSARSATDEPVPTRSRWAYRRGLVLSLIVAMMWGIDLVLLK
ncbi:MAG: DMT family transporter, partial [Gammaproteobacteria bacterium]|nr:DMT family transporter [Gammaproteobacteria bacterium]